MRLRLVVALLFVARVARADDVATPMRAYVEETMNAKAVEVVCPEKEEDTKGDFWCSGGLEDGRWIHIQAKRKADGKIEVSSITHYPPPGEALPKLLRENGYPDVATVQCPPLAGTVDWQFQCTATLTSGKSEMVQVQRRELGQMSFVIYGYVARKEQHPWAIAAVASGFALFLLSLVRLASNAHTSEVKRVPMAPDQMVEFGEGGAYILNHERGYFKRPNPGFTYGMFSQSGERVEMDGVVPTTSGMRESLGRFTLSAPGTYRLIVNGIKSEDDARGRAVVFTRPIAAKNYKWFLGSFVALCLAIAGFSVLA